LSLGEAPPQLPVGSYHTPRPPRGPALESTVCPNCRQVIRLPAEVLGQTAQCPFCKCHFRAPIRTPDGLTEPVLIRRNLFAKRAFAPGIALLLYGLLGLLFNGVQAVRGYADPETLNREMRDELEKAAERTNTPELREMIEPTLTWWPRIRLASAALSLVTIAGAVSMLREKRHGLAMLGGVTAMFNVASCCCFIGIALGGWSLFVLMNPDVRAGFDT
jgi:hypothetical protein